MLGLGLTFADAQAWPVAFGPTPLKAAGGLGTSSEAAWLLEGSNRPFDTKWRNELVSD